MLRRMFPAIFKWVFLVLILSFVLLQAMAGGTASPAPFDAVSEAVLGAAEMENMTLGDNQMIRRLYGLDPGDYEGVLLYYPSTNMGTDEIFLVKLSDLGQQETVKKAMEQRLQSQMDVFEGYAPAQYAALEQGIVEVRGNYLLLLVAEDAGPVRHAFLDAL